MNDYVDIIKCGMLYCVKGYYDIVILHFLLHYKRKNKNKVILYFSKPTKVINVLKCNHINYKYNNELVTFNDNRYFDVFNNGCDKIKFTYKLNRIKKKYYKLTIKDKILVIDAIERYLDEREFQSTE